jgi:hypothetical protein
MSSRNPTKISANSFLAERKQIADRGLLCRIFLEKPSFFRTDFVTKLGPQFRLLPVPNFGINTNKKSNVYTFDSKLTTLIDEKNY